MRLMFRRGEFFDDEGNKLSTKAESPAGHIIEVAVLKTKVCKWNRKLGFMHLSYSKGVDILEDTIDVATHFGWINGTNWFTFVDPDTGEMLCDDNGKEIKLQGRKNVKKYLEEHKDIWNKIYKSVYDKLTIKEDPYIKSFEEMLQTNVEEHFGVNLNEEQ